MDDQGRWRSDDRLLEIHLNNLFPPLFYPLDSGETETASKFRLQVSAIAKKLDAKLDIDTSPDAIHASQTSDAEILAVLTTKTGQIAELDSQGRWISTDRIFENYLNNLFNPLLYPPASHALPLTSRFGAQASAAAMAMDGTLDWKWQPMGDLGPPGRVY